MKSLLTAVMVPIAAITALPAALLVASVFGAVTFQWWMLSGLVLPMVLVGE